MTDTLLSSSTKMISTPTIIADDNDDVFTSFSRQKLFIPLTIVVFGIILIVVMYILCKLSRSRSKIRDHPSRFDLGLSEVHSNEPESESPKPKPVALELEVEKINNDNAESENSDRTNNLMESIYDECLSDFGTPGNLIDKDVKDIDVDNIDMDENDMVIIHDRKHKETDGGWTELNIDDRKHRGTDGGISNGENIE